MAANQQRNIKMIGIAGLAVLAIAGGALIGYPLIGSTQRWADETAAAEQANDALQAKIDSLTVTKELTPEVIALNNELVAKFPNLPNGTALLSDISQAASQAGMNSSNIENVEISLPELLTSTNAANTDTTNAEATDATAGQSSGNSTSGGSSQIASMKINVTVVGNGSQLSGFLAALYDTNRVIKIDSVALSAEEEGNSMTIAATTYLYAPLDPPPGVETQPNPTPTPTPTPTPGVTNEPTNTPTPNPTETPAP